MYSPLRYPGGKSRLSKFIGQAICNLQIHNCTYIEPFAGGAGVALSLLLDGVVENIVINDYDKAIYSFWRALKQEPTALIEKIQSTPITIEEWHRQKEIYVNVVIPFSKPWWSRPRRESAAESAGGQKRGG